MKPKKRKKKIILTAVLSILALLLLFAGILFIRANYLMTPTKGEQITAYDNPKSALLVIDVQNDTIKNPAYKNVDTLLKEINNAVTYAGSNGMEIIYIRQEYQNNPLDFLLSFGMYQANREGSELSSRLQLKPDVVFTKYKSDAFSSKPFEEFLKGEQIDTLYLVGADASACVYKTAIGAVNRGYRVNILKDAVFAGSEDILNEMLEKYSKNGIEVTTTEVLTK